MDQVAASAMHFDLIGDVGTSILHSIRSGNFLQAELQLYEAKRNGCESKAFYHSLITACTKEIGRPSDVMWLVDFMTSSGYKPNVVTFNCIISAYMKVSDIGQAIKSWNSMTIEFGLRPNVISYNIMIHGSAKILGPPAAEEWLHRMINANVRPDAASYSMVIDVFAKDGNAEAAESWLRASKADQLEVHTFAYNSLLNTHAKSKNQEKCERFYLRKMNGMVKPNVTTFNCLMNACAKRADIQRAEYWYTQMLAQGLHPDVVSYGTLLNACAKAKDFKRAAQWMDMMFACNLQPNIRCFNCLIQAAADAGDGNMMQHWFQRMQQQGLAPDTFTIRLMTTPIDSDAAVRSQTCSNDGSFGRGHSSLSSLTDQAELNMYSGPGEPLVVLRDRSEHETSSLSSTLADVRRTCPNMTVGLVNGKLVFSV